MYCSSDGAFLCASEKFSVLAAEIFLLIILVCGWISSVWYSAQMLGDWYYRRFNITHVGFKSNWEISSSGFRLDVYIFWCVFGGRWGIGVKNPLFTRGLGDWCVYKCSLPWLIQGEFGVSSIFCWFHRENWIFLVGEIGVWVLWVKGLECLILRGIWGMERWELWKNYGSITKKWPIVINTIIIICRELLLSIEAKYWCGSIRLN